MRRILSLIAISICTCLASYSQQEGWQVHLSYQQPVQLQEAGDILYIVTKGSGTKDSHTGNLVRYDIEDGSIKTYDCLHDLSDKEIAHISYNQATARLVIVYTSGNIDLLDADNQVWNISALKDASIPGDNVNGIGHVGETAYLCISSGIIEIDCREAVVGETYRSMESQPNSLVEFNDMLYVATSKGLYRFPRESNMHDKTLWATPINTEEFLQLVVYSGRVFARKPQGFAELRQNGSSILHMPTLLTYLSATDDRMILGVQGSTFILEGQYKNFWNDNIRVRHSTSVGDVAWLDGRYYVADGMVGLYSCLLQESTFLDQQQVYSVNSPRRDLFYHMRYEGDRLLVAGGINTQLAAYYPTTFMYMEDDAVEPRWTLFDESSLATEYPHLSNTNSVDLVQDPMDANHFYGAVSRNGLHEYHRTEANEVQLVKVHNYTNSPLACIPVTTSAPWNYCTCTALQYDQRGNLWMANQQTDTIVRILRPNGKWLALYYPEIAEAENVYQYLFSSHDINFMVSHDGGPHGFFGFDTRGTLNILDDDRHLLRSSITNQDGTTVNPSLFYCMTEDHDHQIWCGTSEGLFVITNPREWFSADFSFHQIKRARNDGSGFADYLLSGMDITCIAVDPSNRKWIGTLRNGVYLVSHDGQETIHHFTQDNSPLLSNRIHSIAIHTHTGRVMFGTDAGLCSYDAQVTTPQDELDEETVLAYPNPVRPGTNSMVTIEGLTDGAEVKILSSSGRAVWGATSQGGTVRWNCTNMHGERVPSGVYHVVSNTADAADVVVTRIVVIK